MQAVAAATTLNVDSSARVRERLVSGRRNLSGVREKGTWPSGQSVQSARARDRGKNNLTVSPGNYCRGKKKKKTQAIVSGMRNESEKEPSFCCFSYFSFLAGGTINDDGSPSFK
jgi:hypothetical protein